MFFKSLAHLPIIFRICQGYFSIFSEHCSVSQPTYGSSYIRTLTGLSVQFLNSLNINISEYIMRFFNIV